ncbi:MAG: aminopeptidase [Ignavibacteria bacterium]|jgi:leucyl aminopeptidase (aminopeptidase T)|nr:aminopeptidase [Ignavibacteria bacterium]MCU7501703.1 aminopeptidase [Ignavibacteria bacterium]MCU7516890.1 aminopeptidase [Ignavibacteria bacterium]
MAKTKLDKAAVIAIKDCMGTKKKEKILVVTDEIKREIGYVLYNNALDLGYEALLIEMKSRLYNGEEPPVEVAELMQKFDVVFCPTAKSLTHTDARRTASEKGVRIATFPGITPEVMIRGLNADYKKIAALTLRLKKIFEKTRTVRVTSPAGTDITMDITGRTAYASKGLFHKKGESGNLPTGETFVAPREGTSQGVVVVDGSMAGLGMIKNANIKIQVEDGFATRITGGPEARKLIKLLDVHGKDARNVAEFGIGTNDKAKLSGILLEDEKVMGTIHIAFGDNKSMGGSVHVESHLDGLVKKPTVYFDGRIIMKDGKLLVE